MADLNAWIKRTGVGRKKNKAEWYKYGITATICHLDVWAV
jgi:hypothetical protein